MRGREGPRGIRARIRTAEADIRETVFKSQLPGSEQVVCDRLLDRPAPVECERANGSVRGRRAHAWLGGEMRSVDKELCSIYEIHLARPTCCPRPGQTSAPDTASAAHRLRRLWRVGGAQRHGGCCVWSSCGLVV